MYLPDSVIADQAILLADAGEVIRFLIFFIIVGASLLGKLLSAQPRHRPQRPPRPLPGPQPPGAAGPAGPGHVRVPREGGRRPPATDIEREIDEFLRRRGGRPPVQPVPAEPTVVAEALPDQASRHRANESVAGHVQQHMRAGDVSQHASTLGAKLAQADERLEGHLRDVFEHDHQLGSLTKSPTGRDQRISQGTDADVWQTGGRSVSAAQHFRNGIVDMLRSPQDVRKVIVLSEILKRPSTR